MRKAISNKANLRMQHTPVQKECKITHRNLSMCKKTVDWLGIAKSARFDKNLILVYLLLYLTATNGSENKETNHRLHYKSEMSRFGAKVSNVSLCL